MKHSNTYQDCAVLLCEKDKAIATRRNAYIPITQAGLVDEAIAVFAAAAARGLDLLSEIAKRYNDANPSQAVLAKAAREAEKAAIAAGATLDAPVLTPDSKPMTLASTAEDIAAQSGPTAAEPTKRKTRKKGGA